MHTTYYQNKTYPYDWYIQNVIRYKIKHEVRYVNKYVDNATSLQMARISLIDEKTDLQNNGRNMICFDVYFVKFQHNYFMF